MCTRVYAFACMFAFVTQWRENIPLAAHVEALTLLNAWQKQGSIAKHNVFVGCVVFTARGKFSAKKRYQNRIPMLSWHVHAVSNLRNNVDNSPRKDHFNHHP